MIKVAKFGGSSLASAEQIKKAVNIIRQDHDRKYVVPSAPGKRFSEDIKVTDLLYKCYSLAGVHGDEDAAEAYEETFKKIKGRYNDIIRDLGLDFSLDKEFEILRDNFDKRAGSNYAASRGEYLNGKIIAAYLGFPFVDAATVIFFAEDGTLDVEKTNEALTEALQDKEHAVIPGFYGCAFDGSVKTFSRGGSDITGSIVARAVHADVYENWTDVSGVLITDPHIIPGAKTIDVITYRELRELSYMGATVLHEEAVFPVRSEGIPINIRNTNKPDDKGTLIVEATCKKPKYIITGIAGKKDFASVTIEKALMNSQVGFCRDILDVFANNGVSIEHMPSGIDTMSIYVHEEEFEKKEQKIIAGIHKKVNPDYIELESDLAIIAVVGRGMRSTRGTSGRIFSALSHANINVKMIDQGSSELNIIIGIKNRDFEEAIKAIYDIFVTTQI